MKVDKKNVDELIRITKKYFRTGDVDLLPKKNIITDEIGKEVHYSIGNLIEDLAKYTYDKNISYEKIYDALKIFGIEVE